MEHFETVLIGSGYSSIGYAAAHQSTLIIEEQEIADTHFYLPLRSFRYTPYVPKTKEGAALDATFRSLGLFEGDKQNTNGFEPALCRYLERHPLPILLKARVVDRKKSGSSEILTLSTNEGLLQVSCNRVYDTRNTEKRSLSVLVIAKNPGDAARAAALTGWELTEAFHPNWYALHVPYTGESENDVKITIHNTLSKIDGIRLLSIAPVYAGKRTEILLSDDSYDNPIAAFEAGYFLGRE